MIDGPSPQHQATKKRSARITGIPDQVPIPTTITTPSDAVNYVIPIAHDGQVSQVPIDEAMTTAIRDTLARNPQWSPSGLDASNSPLLLLNNLAEDSRAIVIRNSENELS